MEPRPGTTTERAPAPPRGLAVFVLKVSAEMGRQQGERELLSALTRTPLTFGGAQPAGHCHTADGRGPEVCAGVGAVEGGCQPQTLQSSGTALAHACAAGGVERLTCPGRRRAGPEVEAGVPLPSCSPWPAAYGNRNSKFTPGQACERRPGTPPGRASELCSRAQDLGLAVALRPGAAWEPHPGLRGGRPE